VTEKTQSKRKVCNTLIQQGIDAENSGNHELALLYFHEVTVNEGTPASLLDLSLVFFFSACILEKLGNIEESEQCLNKLSKINPKKTDIINLLNVYQEQFNQEVPKKATALLSFMKITERQK
jgi:tetratricopeptide (TPR) repeat protein